MQAHDHMHFFQAISYLLIILPVKIINFKIYNFCHPVLKSCLECNAFFDSKTSNFIMQL